MHPSNRRSVKSFDVFIKIKDNIKLIIKYKIGN